MKQNGNGRCTRPSTGTDHAVAGTKTSEKTDTAGDGSGRAEARRGGSAPGGRNGKCVARLAGTGVELVAVDPNHPNQLLVAPLTRVKIGPAEFSLLAILADGKLHSGEELYRLIFRDKLIESGAIFALVRRLRLALGSDAIICYPKKGYVLAPGVVVLTMSSGRPTVLGPDCLN